MDDKTNQVISNIRRVGEAFQASWVNQITSDDDEDRDLTEVEESSVRFGDALYDLILRAVFTMTYPVFSVIRSAWRAISEAWREAK